MVQPLTADLLAGALAHGLPDIVALAIGMQAVDPHQHGVLILALELRLAVDGPGEVPVLHAILYGDDTAGGHLAGTGIALADIHNVADDFLISGGNRGTHPVGGLHIAAEGVGVAVFAVPGLGGYGLPHIPRFAAAVMDAGEIGGVGLVAVAGGIGAAAVGDEHKVVLDEINGLLLAVLHIDDLAGYLLVALCFNNDIADIHAVFDADAVALQVLDQRQDHALVLIVLCKAQGAEIGQAIDVVDIAAEVALHFQGAGPLLEGEHGLPIQPEVGAPEALRQHLGDLFALQVLFRGDEQLGECHGAFFIQRELLIGVGVLAAVYGGAAQGVVGVVLIEPIVFIQYGYTGGFDGGHIAEGIPHHLKVVIHFAAAAHIKALGDILAAIAAAAGQVQLFQQVDALAFHLAIAHQVKCGGKTGQAGADDIGGFVIDALGLFGVSKAFVGSSGIIHK